MTELHKKLVKELEFFCSLLNSSSADRKYALPIGQGKSRVKQSKGGKADSDVPGGTPVWVEPETEQCLQL